MQNIKDQIVEDFLSGDRERKAKAAELYEETFELDQIQSEAICCGTIAPNRVLEFDRDHLEIVEESLSPGRMEELEAGAEPTPDERKRYREAMIQQIKDGDSDADETPGFWIHAIRNRNGEEVFALTTATGYSFSGIFSEFQGLFAWERECIDFLKECGVITETTDLQPMTRDEPSNQLSLSFPGKQRKKSSRRSARH